MSKYRTYVSPVETQSHSLLPKGTHRHTHWRKPFTKPDKPGLYQVKVTKEANYLWASWSGQSWSLMAPHPKDLVEPGIIRDCGIKPNQQKYWRGLTTIAYLAS